MERKISGIETKVEFDGRVFAISLGYKTKWFEQIPTIMVIEEEYDENRNVVWASVLWEKTI
jgi:hypothetical protein